MSNQLEPVFNFTFKTREEYVAWRANWRAEYAKLSADIRKAKLEYKQDQRDGGCPTRGYIFDMKNAASNMILERMASKVEANRQYLASKGQEVVPDPSTIVSGSVVDAPEEFFEGIKQAMSETSHQMMS